MREGLSNCLSATVAGVSSPFSPPTAYNVAFSGFSVIKTLSTLTFLTTFLNSNALSLDSSGLYGPASLNTWLAIYL